MDFRALRCRHALAVVLFFVTSAATAAWQRIDVDQQLLTELFGDDAAFPTDGRPRFIDDEGIERIPGCSEGPMPLIDTSGKLVGPIPPIPADGRFSFFVDTDTDAGYTSDLLLYLAGGGACWDGGTCVGSALTPAPTYSKFVFETTQGLNFLSRDLDGSGAGGILTNRSDNPYAGFARVYVPYCTGDIHIGSSDTAYRYTLPPELGGATLDWTIRHRGFDNLLVVLKWLERYLEEPGTDPIDSITVAGSSGGGYGALINFPLIRETLGDDPDYFIMADAASGVLTDGFLDLAFGPPGREGVWRAKRNVDPLLRPVLDLPADKLMIQALVELGHEYKHTRISQSTTAYDVVQTHVLMTMQQVDDGTYDPFAPVDEDELTLAALFDWSPKARSIMRKSALKVRNFRYYLAAGQGHIHLLDPPQGVFGFPTPNYFDEASAGGVHYTAWLYDMLWNPRRYFHTAWRNLTCFPRCLK